MLWGLVLSARPVLAEVAGHGRCLWELRADLRVL